MPRHSISVAAVAAVGLAAGAAAVAAIAPGAAATSGSRALVATPSGSIQFDAGGPVRILDTRYDLGTDGCACQPGLMPTVLAGRHVPAEATAVFVNVTVLAPEAGAFGFLGVYAGATPGRGTSTLNWDRPGVYSNMAMVPINAGLLPPDGTKTFQLRYQGSGRIDVVVDLLSWVVPAPA